MKKLFPSIAHSLPIPLATVFASPPSGWRSSVWPSPSHRSTLRSGMWIARAMTANLARALRPPFAVFKRLPALPSRAIPYSSAMALIPTWRVPMQSSRSRSPADRMPGLPGEPRPPHTRTFARLAGWGGITVTASYIVINGINVTGATTAFLSKTHWPIPKRPGPTRALIPMAFSSKAGKAHRTPSHTTLPFPNVS